MVSKMSDVITLRNPVTGFTCKMPVTLPNIIQWAQSKGYEIVSETTPWCYLNIEYYEPEGDYYWHGRIGSIFEDVIEHARLCKREWAIVRKDMRGRGDNIIIAQSKNWRDRTGQR